MRRGRRRLRRRPGRWVRWWSWRFSPWSGPPPLLRRRGPLCGFGLLVDDQLVEQLHGVAPRLVAVRLAGVELLDGRPEHLRLDDGVVRSLVLGDDALGALTQDLADRGIVEELRQVALTGDARVGLGGGHRREGARGLEGLDLRLGG